MKNRGLLLDRDGIINIDTHYVGKSQDFEFVPGIFPFLREIQNIGFRLAIVTNQSGVARGYFTVRDFYELSEWMYKKFTTEGISIDLTLVCFEHAEGIQTEHRMESYWRKPNPGMVLEAIQRLRLDPKRSAFLGDSVTDMQAARAGGIQTCLLMNSQLNLEETGSQKISNFEDALKILRN